MNIFLLESLGDDNECLQGKHNTARFIHNAYDRQNPSGKARSPFPLVYNLTHYFPTLCFWLLNLVLDIIPIGKLQFG